MITAAEIYDKLFKAYGQPRWWSDDPYTVMMQSVLVQNTAWTSVEKVTNAISNGPTPKFVLGLSQEELEDLIHPCGFAKGKTATILRLTEWYGKYGYERSKVQALDITALRKELLAIKGVGAETADVILVYAFHKPSFVIDAYTRRFLERLGFCFTSGEEIRMFFESGIERDYQFYGWYHWLLLDHGIQHCKKTPSCEGCVFGA